MKALIQRVCHAHISVHGERIADIQHGVLAYIGIAKGDDVVCARRLVDKILSYRIFTNASGKMDKSLRDTGGELLLVSQFTLMANTHKGLRPDFAPAMPPHDAKELFATLILYAKDQYPHIQTGQFGADMLVTATTDGPVNFVLEV